MKPKKDYAVLELHDYLVLKTLASANREVKRIMIKAEDLIFLSAVLIELNVSSNSELYVSGTTATIKAKTKDGNEINSTFDISLCEKYYNNASKFIKEVL